MTWYNKTVEAAPRAFLNNDRIEVVDIFTPYGAGENIGDKGREVIQNLKQLGFRYEPNSKTWYADPNNINPASISRLQGVGVDVSQLPNDARGGQVRRPSMVIRPPATKNWILAIARSLSNIPAGEPVAVSVYDNNRMVVQDETQTKRELVPKAQIQQIVESFKDKEGNRISSPDVKYLFERYKELVSMPTVEQDPVEEDTDVVPEEKKKGNGRIPEDMISPYQKEIETTFLETDKDIVINALAGTGKTSVLKHLASFKDPNEKWLYLVFNKKNQLESEKEFPEGVTVLTSHSFLSKILQKVPADVMPKSEVKTSSDRTGGMVDDALEISTLIPRNMKIRNIHQFPDGKVYYNAKVALKKIVDMCKANAIDPNAPDIKDQILGVIDQYDINTDIQNTNKKGEPLGRPMVMTDELIEEAIVLLKESLPGASLERYEKIPYSNRKGMLNNRRKYEGYMNFDDILWYTALNQDYIDWPYFDVVLADEVQDFNKCQQIMLNNLQKVGAKVVAVGDPHQSIYAFRGADANSFSKVQEVVAGEEGDNGSIHELPVNYRCGSNIIDFVNQDELSPVDNLQCGIDEEGEVKENIQTQDEAVQSVIEEYKHNKRLSVPTAFIARTNNILQKTALQLITEDVEFEFIGNDVSRKLMNLCSQIVGRGRKKKTLKMGEFADNLKEYFNRFMALSQDKIRMKDIVTDTDMTYKALRHILMNMARSDDMGNVYFFDKERNMKVENTDQFISYLTNKFKGLNFDSENQREIEKVQKFQERDPHEYIALCSAHRSKGLEFDRVYILGSDQFPSPQAKSPKEREQERNVWYVALTRAKKQLHIPLPQPPDDQDDGRDQYGF